jgi:hypothetical protein
VYGQKVSKLDLGIPKPQSYCYSFFQKQILEQLLAGLLSKLQSNQINMDIAANFIHTTHLLTSTKDNRGWNLDEGGKRDLIYQFCSHLPQSDGWVQVVLAAGVLTCHWHWLAQKSPDNLAASGWVYEALKKTIIPTQDTAEWDSKVEPGVAGLLLALHYYGTPPSKEHIHLILQAISAGGDFSRNAGLLLLQENLVDWFHDAELGPILQKASVWPFLTQWIIQEDYDLSREGIVLGQALSEIPDWEPHLHQDLCFWITIFVRKIWMRNYDLSPKYNSVLTKIWKPCTDEYVFINPREGTLGLTYATLSSFWDALDFSALSGVEKLVSWLRLSFQVSLHKDYTVWNENESKPESISVTPDFKAAFYSPLHNSLVAAADRARHEMAQNSPSNNEESSLRKTDLGKISKILDNLASEMQKSADDFVHWYEEFNSEIDAVEQLLGRSLEEPVSVK